MREKLPDDRKSVTLHFTITSRVSEDADAAVMDYDGYIHAGEYPDGRLGEVFVKCAQVHESFGPMLDAWAKQFSFCLQSGVYTVDFLCSKHIAEQMLPRGPVKGVKDIRYCTGTTDLICKWLALKYGSPKMRERILALTPPVEVQP